MLEPETKISENLFEVPKNGTKKRQLPDSDSEQPVKRARQEAPKGNVKLKTKEPGKKNGQRKSKREQLEEAAKELEEEFFCNYCDFSSLASLGVKVGSLKKGQTGHTQR